MLSVQNYCIPGITLGMPGFCLQLVWHALSEDATFPDLSGVHLQILNPEQNVCILSDGESWLPAQFPCTLDHKLNNRIITPTGARVIISPDYKGCGVIIKGYTIVEGVAPFQTFGSITSDRPEVQSLLKRHQFQTHKSKFTEGLSVSRSLVLQSNVVKPECIVQLLGKMGWDNLESYFVEDEDDLSLISSGLNTPAEGSPSQLARALSHSQSPLLTKRHKPSSEESPEKNKKASCMFTDTEDVFDVAFKVLLGESIAKPSWSTLKLK